MGLTSMAVLLLAIAAAVALFALTIWLWPRLGKKSIGSVLARFGMLLATQLTLFAAIGLWANQSFGFFASWADLFGLEKGQGVVVDHSQGNKPVQVVGIQQVKGHGSVPSIAGKVEKVNIRGSESKIASPAFVYLPPEYFQPEYANKTFPASVVLTGYPGTAEALIKGLHYPQEAQKLAKAKKMQPTILVMMRPTVAPPRDTECIDIPGGPQTETFFTKDLRKALSEQYRIGLKAANWGVIGDSTGGYCALKFAMRHPDSYGAAAALSGYYDAKQDATTGSLFGGDKKLEKDNDLMWRLKNKPLPPVSLLVTSSKQGEDNYDDTKKFIAASAHHPTRVSSMILEVGGHNFNTWRREIPGTLQWMGSRLSA
ncbi:esterase family protein [Streptomyces sp. UNOC14_S4]|uniref:alpha/beta hydrolase n=1 Tax=Streptomyces sp. UNOC14_S4 TaxID=2872340 RepID=UPI001E43F097|nr:alpha/beta hydrolase-fold protein [Streptomyces sp. UNOC14_S4]MCC3769692.1 esterase [Streptomyces sp. UNOC14_S4]